MLHLRAATGLRTMRTRAATISLTALSLAGCIDLTNPNRTAQSAAGVYVLQSVNGIAPPATVQTRSGATLTVRSDTYSINPDGTYTEQASYTNESGGTSTLVSLSQSGYWTQSNTAVLFQPTYDSEAVPGVGLASYIASVSTSATLGGTVQLTLPGNGFVEILTRQ